MFKGLQQEEVCSMPLAFRQRSFLMKVISSLSERPWVCGLKCATDLRSSSFWPKNEILAWLSVPHFILSLLLYFYCFVTVMLHAQCLTDSVVHHHRGGVFSWSLTARTIMTKLKNLLWLWIELIVVYTLLPIYSISMKWQLNMQLWKRMKTHGIVW